MPRRGKRRRASASDADREAREVADVAARALVMKTAMEAMQTAEALAITRQQRTAELKLQREQALLLEQAAEKKAETDLALQGEAEAIIVGIPASHMIVSFSVCVCVCCCNVLFMWLITRYSSMFVSCRRTIASICYGADPGA